MFKNLFKISLIVTSIVMFSCAAEEELSVAEQGASETTGKINVLATTPMIGEYVSEIGGDNINLTILMPPEVDPHTYDPTPQDAGKIADADLIFYVGLKYEPTGLIQLLENSSSGENVLVEVGEGINPIEFKEGGHDDHDDHEGHDDHDDHEGHDDHDDHEGHEGHDHGLYDPHFWFDPMRVAMASEMIKDKLVEFDPENKESYESLASDYVIMLNDLDESVTEMIAKVPEKNRKLITTHESLGYLENRYGVKVLTTIIPSIDSANEISPSQLVDVIEIIEHNNIKVLFVESEAPSIFSETISAESGIDLVTGLWVETLKVNQSYKDFILSNVELIVENLDHEDHGDDHEHHDDHDDHEDHDKDEDHDHEHEGKKE